MSHFGAVVGDTMVTEKGLFSVRLKVLNGTRFELPLVLFLFRHVTIQNLDLKARPNLLGIEVTNS